MARKVIADQNPGKGGRIWPRPVMAMRTPRPGVAVANKEARSNRPWLRRLRGK